MNGLAMLLAAAILAQAEVPATPPPAPAPSPAPAEEVSPGAAPASPSRTETGSATPTSTPTPTPPPTPTSPRVPSPEDRALVARAALAFLDALVARDAERLAAASTERFSFDGEVRAGKDAIRRAWRDLLARRPAASEQLLDVEVLPAPDALARLGPPPSRVAPLAPRGGWVAIGDVSGRPVVLFLARDGARWAVAGIHD